MTALPGHIGGRGALSPLRNLCSPIVPCSSLSLAVQPKASSYEPGQINFYSVKLFKNYFIGMPSLKTFHQR